VWSPVAVCALAVGLKYRLGFDDSLDVVGVHFVGGWIGCLWIGFFATYQSGFPNTIMLHEGLFYGDKTATQLISQAEGAGIVTVWSFVVALVNRLPRQGGRPVPAQAGARGRGHRTSASTPSPRTTSRPRPVAVVARSRRRVSRRVRTGRVGVRLTYSYVRSVWRV